MSAEILREAAALMRERAAAATPGPWSYESDDHEDPVIIAAEPHPESVGLVGGYGVDLSSCYVAQTSYDGLSGTTYNSDADAEHIASWHPDVALAVANLLDEAASGWHKEQDRQWGLVLIRHDWQVPEGTSERNELQRKCDKAADARFEKALAVADAYLGSDQ